MKSVLFVFLVTGSGYVEYTTFLGMELHLPVSSHLANLSRSC